MSQVQGEWGSRAQAKQKRWPQAHSGSQCTSPGTRMARPQCGTLGHHLTSWLSCAVTHGSSCQLFFLTFPPTCGRDV